MHHGITVCNVPAIVMNIDGNFIFGITMFYCYVIDRACYNNTFTVMDYILANAVVAFIIIGCTVLTAAF